MGRKIVLVLGGTGLLGKALVESCPKDVEVCATHLRDLPAEFLSSRLTRLDVTDREETLRVFEEVRPDAVVHLAGVGSVDFAEQNQCAAWGVNVGGTQHVIEACRRLGAKLIFVSSNAVFDGHCPPYDEKAVRRPVNYYGQLKVEAEDAVRSSGLHHAVVRAILMYGWHYSHARENPATMWIRLLREGKSVKVVNDRYWQPLYVEDCANLIWRILEKDKTGVFNISGPDRLSLFEFALHTAKVFDLDSTLIEPVPSDYFPTIAPRPEDTSFVVEKIRKELGIEPVGIAAGLERMKKIRISGRSVPNEIH
jgi:dTDP-4-dehydrorhamnose reductase